MAFVSSFYNYSDWSTISLGAAAIAILGSVALIMLSRLFSLRNLEQVAKTEFVYAVSTILIVLMAVGIIQLAEPQIGGPSNSLARCLYLSALGTTCDDPTAPASFDQQQTLIDWMNLYMKTPADCIQGFMSAMYMMEIPIGAMTSVYMEIFMSEHASGFGVKWIEERIMNATTSFSFYVYMYFLQYHVFNFVKSYAGFFFSIGVALRAFPPTRGGGAYLMAMAFGLYFVFPLAYILIATLGLPHTQSNLVSFDPNGVGGSAYQCSLPAIPDATSYSCGAADVGRVLEYRDHLIANREQLSTLLTIQMPDFERTLTHSICVFPMISFVVLLTFVLNTTTLFGGNIPEIGRGLVKLI